MSHNTHRRHPLLALDEEDLEFVLRMVLASGSLKDLAQSYDISYPTIRARLDRVIARLHTLMDGRPPDPMAELLADLVERGELATKSARAILQMHRRHANRTEESES